ncbi:MAG: hypothetical protein HRU74_11570 [Chthonomonadaceae bacterium]|nr:MAG: hypothetical protein HRU74_11570 [Chthonomonadaceae bacterium]
MSMRSVVIFAIVACLAIGCSPPTKELAEAGQEPAPAPDVQAPASSGSEAPKSDAPKADVAALKGAWTQADKDLAEKPADEGVQKAYIAASLKYAEATMYADEIPAKEKYPEALRVYRTVLKVDPANQEAKEWIKTIEDIYASMGRPVPE